MKILSAVLAASTISLLANNVPAADVDFITLANERRTGTTVWVRMNPEDVLVFKSTDRYVLHGRRLVINARTIRVDGQFTIQQFGDSDTPLPKQGTAPQPQAKPKASRTSGRKGADGATGSQGNQGAQGDPGKNAPMIVLDIERVLGSGVLTIINAGGIGGQGQQGSQGGTGGAGEEGAKGVDGFAHCMETGGDGGYGGRGGKGGTGGTGGMGGNGGTVKISAPAKVAVDSKHIVVDVSGGTGGDPGPGGLKGQGGAGGAGGSGSIHCSGGRGQPSLGDGDPGDEGKPGEKGKPGQIVVI